MLSYKLKSIALGFMVAATLFATSCDKDEKTQEPELEKATITITTPTESQTFESDETVSITGKIEYSKGLHGFQIVIRQKSDNTVKYEKDVHAHGASINIDESWINNLHGHNDMELEVIAILDHDGKTSSKKVNFHCHGH